MVENNVIRHRLVIVGAGSAGLTVGVNLKKAGIEDFVILEKGTGVGGTWYHNTYPGAECDVQSHLYQFSFEQKNDWSAPYGGQGEILEYINHCYDKFDVRRHVQFGTKVETAVWDEDESLWRITTEAGETFETQVLVSGLGMFNDLKWPTIPGIEDFEGDYFHSARWNHDIDLAGKRVGVIGLAASAIQFAPELAKEVEHLTLYQRTANWVVPKPNTPHSDQTLADFKADPSLVTESRDEIYDAWNTLCTFTDQKILSGLEAAGMERIEIVEDPETREKLVPHHPFGCKRPLFSDLYYPIFNRDNVELVTEKVDQVTSKGVISDGVEREFDVIVYSTGFRTTNYLSSINVTGRNGVSLQDAWSDGAQAYLGITTAGFPNLFMLYGPNTNQGSIMFMLEAQTDYIMRQLERMEEESLAWIDIRKEVMDDFNSNLQTKLLSIDVWQAECGNDAYYRSGPNKRMVVAWPGSMDAYTEATTRAEPESFEVEVSRKNVRGVWAAE